MNEYRVQEAMSLSNRIQNATLFDIHKENFDSENYQVMNYGIGGTISGHVDSNGNHTCLFSLSQASRLSLHLHWTTWAVASNSATIFNI